MGTEPHSVGSRRAARLSRRGAVAAAVFGLGLASVLLPSVASGATPASHPAKNTWHVQATLGLGPGGTAVSCAPSHAACLAIEAGTLLSSADGGQHWSDLTELVPGDVASLQAVSCPSQRTCLLTATSTAGGPLVLSFVGGQVSELAVPGTAPYGSIDCPSSRHCLVTDGHQVQATHDGGQTWVTHLLPTIVYSNAAIGCVSRSKTCVIVGDNGETPIIERTSNDGTTWQSAPAPGDTDGLYDVACPDATTCYAVGANFPDQAIVIASTDGAKTWSFEQVPTQAYALRSISCVSTTRCSAGGADAANAPDLFATTDGVHWAKQSLPASQGGMAAVACLSEADCTAVSGGITFVTADGGATWTGTEAPAVPNPPQAIDCPSATVCVALSNDALGRPESLTSDDAGVTWTAHPMNPKAGRLWDLACPTVDDCFAVSQGRPGEPSAIIAHALVSTDGGVTWATGSLDSNRGVLGHITCPTTSTCMASGFGHGTNVWLKATTDSGHTWTSVTAPAGALYSGGLSCTSPTSCLLVTAPPSGSDTAWTTSDLGASWQPHAMPNDLSAYYDVGCAATTCVAVGSNGGDGAIAVSNDGGLTWVAGPVPPESELLAKVTCSTATTCIAAGYNYRDPGGGPVIVGTTDAGGHFHVFAVPAGKEQPIDVSCAGSSCFATDQSTTGNPVVLAGRA